jgi:glycosyltransferase involved in cell wall biosynthesis
MTLDIVRREQVAGRGPPRAPTEQSLAALCVCTRGRPRMAKRCLESLRSQSADGVDVCIIVVDNDATGSARSAFDEVFTARDNARYVLCREPGIPFARNAALEAARGAGADYVAFLDDDEAAPPGWFAALFATLCSSGADAVQGGVRTAADAAGVEAETARPLAAAGPCKRVETAATCNVVFKARLIEPPFSLRFDETMRYTGGSDRDFFMRAHKQGAMIMKTEHAYVVEEVCAGRDTFAYGCTRAFASGANYTRRMIKNESALTAARRIGFRLLERAVMGALKLTIGVLWLAPLKRKRAIRQFRKGGAHISFAAGGLAALAGVRVQPYRVIQGA